MTKQQKFEIALKQIEARANRFRITAVVIVVIGLLAASVTLYAIFQGDEGSPRVTGPLDVKRSNASGALEYPVSSDTGTPDNEMRQNIINLLKVVPFQDSEEGSTNLDIKVENNSDTAVSLTKLRIEFTNIYLIENRHRLASADSIAATYRIKVSDEQALLHMKTNDHSYPAELYFPSGFGYEGYISMDLWQTMAPESTERFQVFLDFATPPNRLLNLVNVTLEYSYRGEEFHVQKIGNRFLHAIR